MAEKKIDANTRELVLKQARLDHARETSQFIDLAEEFSAP